MSHLLISASHTPRELLAHNPGLELVFDRFEVRREHMDIQLWRVLAQDCPDPAFVVDILNAFDEPASFSTARFRQYPIPVILDYLSRTHRYYLEKRLPEISQTLNGLTLSFGASLTQVLLLNRLFQEYSEELTAHIGVEEKRLFPLIRAIEQQPLPAHAEAICKHLAAHEESLLDVQLRSLLRHVATIPVLRNAFPFDVLSMQLEAFEKDIVLHERLEDEVLIPMALSLSGGA